MNWEQFDKKCDIQGLNDDIKSVNTGDFEDLPVGRYEVKLDSLEMKPTKTKGNPMMVMCFTVVQGEYTKRKIFVNQVLFNGDQNDKYRILGANDLLKGLDSDFAIEFEGFAKYAELIADVASECVDEEYLLEIAENKKGFRNYKIIEHYGM